jgi:hypothetical protein
MTESDWDSMLAQRRRLAQKLSADLRSGQEEEWRSLAGPLYERMLGSRSAAEELLGDEDRNVRLASLGVLSFVWRPKPEDYCATLLEEVALEDVDPQVRATALCALGACHNGTSNPRVGRLVAEIVVDESQPITSRRCAYQALFAIRGAIMPAWPGLYANPQTMLRIPEDVDWAFVESFIQ